MSSLPSAVQYVIIVIELAVLVSLPALLAYNAVIGARRQRQVDTALIEMVARAQQNNQIAAEAARDVAATLRRLHEGTSTVVAADPVTPTKEETPADEHNQ